MRAIVLTAADASPWFAALEAAAMRVDQAKFAQSLAGGPLRPNLRAVIEHEGSLIGRFAAERRKDGIRFWLPAIQPAIPAPLRQEAMRRVIDAVAAERAGAGLETVPLETRPGENAPDCAAWVEVLRAAAFREICTYRVHILEGLRPTVPPPRPPGRQIRAATPLDLGLLPALYRSAYADTLDRRPRALDEAEAYLHDLRSFGAGYAPGLWLIAAVGGDIAGFILVNPAREPALSGLSAWVLEVGCLPRYRGRGVAGSLLAAALPRAGAAGCARLLATIDDRNTPSLRLHAAFGFAPQTQRHYVFRRA